MWTRMASVSLAAFLLASCEREDAPPVPVEERLALPADVANGQRLFRQCAVCHNTAKGAGHRVGPNLWGVYGEAAGRHPDFAYSRALERSGIVWDEETLDAFIEKPEAVVPGGRMAYQGNGNPADRRDIIAYLEALGE